jgi:hypothetical protein
MMMIKKYPAALMHPDIIHTLPIHIECRYKCRSSVVSTCIELYPDSLSKADGEQMLPLHCLLRDVNEIYSEEDALMMIEKYPAALQHQDKYGCLPIHLYCKSAILSKCIELYPESLRVADLQGYLPLHIRLKRYTSSVDDA